MTQLQVRLYRESFSTPWGFRLQGGKDIGQALSIQRVFSNSPAEGELQRGDQILSFAGRPGRELTHQQAQEIAKRGGPHIDIVIYRPVPGRVSTATFVPAAQRTRAQSLQLSPVPSTMPASGDGRLRLNANPCFNPDFIQQYSPSSPIPPPPWTQQQSAPKRVSKLSQIGGGAPDFGVDYGSHYGTVPRRRHSSQTHNYSQYAGGSPTRDYGLSHLGGGNFDFGADYCTLPRTRGRQSSPPSRKPFSTMPVSGGSSGFKPKKVTLSRLGGGGPDFGSDFTRGRPSSYMQPVHVHAGGRGPQQGPPDTYSRLHDSLDLSPRTPDYGYQAPAFAPSSPGGGQYIPTAVRLDMEREEELRQQQLQQQQQQQQQYQPQQQQQPVQQMYYFEPQQPYVPTGVRLDHQMGEEDEQIEQVPVLERRRAFMNEPARSAPAPTGKSTAPKVLRPKPGPAAFNFGVDYSKPAPKTSSVTWRPQPVNRPVNAPPPPEMVQSAPPPWSSSQQQGEVDEPDVPPAWRNTLRTTGVKPWDKDLEYTASQQQAPRSSTQVQNPDKAGDRDWTQSAVYRMIYEEEHRRRSGGQPQQQQQQQQPQQQKPAPPPPAPKPQAQTFQQAFSPMDEYGTSDF
ncbi:uncharacterized protein LOC143283457 isoform X1 [Babylonia areolata]|uniref:uncharacterized protein LOC143283457 isoform X1 n=1 Tax=Babylonia areolata TaxID=304850 RepID=UPI003FD6A135